MSLDPWLAWFFPVEFVLLVWDALNNESIKTMLQKQGTAGQQSQTDLIGQGEVICSKNNFTGKLINTFSSI